MTPPVTPRSDVQSVGPSNFDIVRHDFPEASGFLENAQAHGHDVYTFQATCADGSYHTGVHIPAENQTVMESYPDPTSEQGSTFVQDGKESSEGVPDPCAEPEPEPEAAEPEPSEEKDPEKTDEECKGCIEEPGFAEGMIPLWGSGKSFLAAAQRGQVGWAIFHGVMFVSDAFLVGALAKAAMKAAGKGAGKVIATTMGGTAATEGAEHAGASAAKMVMELGEAFAKLRRLSGREFFNELEALISRFGGRDQILGQLPESAAKVLGQHFDDLLAKASREATELASSMSMKTSPDSLVLFSNLGRPGAAKAGFLSGVKNATTIADAEGYALLQRMQRDMELLAKRGPNGRPLVWEFSRPMWESASVRLAESASGHVTAVIRPPVAMDAVFRSEIQALLRNSDVSSIRIVRRGGGEYVWKRGDGMFNWSSLG